MLALVALAYGPSLRVTYLFDDHDALRQNPYLEEAGTFQWLWKVPPNSSLIGRPALAWSFGLNALATGHRALAYHAVNVAMHLAVVFLVYWLGERALRAAGLEIRKAGAAALLAALVWGLHPLNTQAVAYLIQRGEIQATLFVLLTLACWLKTRSGGGAWWVGGSVLSMFLAVLTKETGWIAPLLPFLWAWVFEKMDPVKLARRQPWLLGAALVSWGMLAAVIGTGGRLEHNKTEDGLGRWDYFITQPEVLSHYLRLMVWPSGQSLDYDWTPATLATAWPWLLKWAGLFGGACWLVWRRKAAGFAAGLFFISLAITSSVINLRDFCYEQRPYLAGAGLWMAAGGLAAHVSGARWRAAWAAAALLAAAALGVLTWQRCVLFQNEWAVWTEAVERNPNQRRALTNLAGLALEKGETRRALELYQRAETLGLQSKMKPRVYFQMGNALMDLNRLEEARGYFQRALELTPDDGRIFANLGFSCLRERKYEEAVPHLRRARELLPGDATLDYAAATAYLRTGRTEEGLAAYREGQAAGRPPPAFLVQLVREAGGRP